MPRDRGDCRRAGSGRPGGDRAHRDHSRNPGRGLHLGRAARAGQLFGGDVGRRSGFRGRADGERLQDRCAGRGKDRSGVPVLRIRHQAADPLHSRQFCNHVCSRRNLARPRGQGARLSQGSARLQRLRRGLEGVLQVSAAAHHGRRAGSAGARRVDRDRPGRRETSRREGIHRGAGHSQAARQLRTGAAGGQPRIRAPAPSPPISAPGSRPRRTSIPHFLTTGPRSSARRATFSAISPGPSRRREHRSTGWSRRRSSSPICETSTGSTRCGESFSRHPRRARCCRPPAS